MDNAIVLFLLRAIHVVGGVLWVGGVVLVTLFLLPATQSLGPAAQPVLNLAFHPADGPEADRHAAWKAPFSFHLVDRGAAQAGRP